MVLLVSQGQELLIQENIDGIEVGDHKAENKGPQGH